jgi:DNA-binding transcriptional LysR family regulator
MDTDRLGVFRAVAREGGFSRAARKLFRTQPAVSQAIRALELELGEQLFVRRGRSTTLTAAGRIFLEHVEDAFISLERGRLRLDALRELKEGSLTIGTSDTTACYVLPPVLAEFRRRYPGVEVCISNRPSPITLDQVVAREVDLGFVTLPATRRGLASESLMVREDVAIFAPTSPLAAGRRIRFAQLLQHPLLLLDRGSQTRSFIDEQIAASGEKADVAMELASIEVIKQLVALDFGVSLVPAISVQREIAAGVLCARSVLPRSQLRQLGAVYADPGPLSPAAAAFLELGRTELGG